jgi:alkylhydroperoxidase family enzyme
VTFDELRPPGGWRGPSEPRIAPRVQRERSALVRSILRVSGVPALDQVPNVFLTLQRSPRLFWPWLLFASRLMPYGTLDVRDRERVILRVAWNCRSRYEWGQHVAIGRRCGLTDRDIRRIAGVDPPSDMGHEETLLAACDEIHADRCISDATWAALRTRYSEETMIELCLLIGHYEMLAGFLNSAGTELEEKVEESLPRAR